MEQQKIKKLKAHLVILQHDASDLRLSKGNYQE